MDPHFDGVIFKTHAAELRRRLARPFPPCVVLDVRPEKDYRRGHIPGAVWGGHLDFARAVPEIGRPGLEVFVVGGEPEDAMARQASLALKRLGARRVVELTGGMVEWELAGGPLEREGDGERAAAA
jgi:rhodanese-related sulfurtransferase